MKEMKRRHSFHEDDLLKRTQIVGTSGTVSFGMFYVGLSGGMSSSRPRLCRRPYACTA